MPLPAPTNLTAVPESSTVIVLNWTDNSSSPNEEGFKIQRATGTGSFISFTQVGRGVTTYRNTQCKPATTYRYRVCAVGLTVAENSPYSNIAEATTP